MSDASIRTATAADAERCVAVLTLAFASDPPCRGAWPDPHQYLEAFPRFARAFGGGALWLPPGVGPDEATLVRIIQDTVSARVD